MNKKVIFLSILAVIIIAGICTVCFINSKNSNEAINSYESYLCGGYVCLNDENSGENKKTYSKCEICGKKMKFFNTNTDKLCNYCSNNSKKCKHCGINLTDEQIAENERKKQQFDKYNKMNISASKVAYINGTNDIIILAKNDDSNLEAKNKLYVINMKDFSIKKELELQNDYLENCNLENSRLEYDSGKILFFNEEESKSFLYDIENQEIKDMEYAKEEQDGRTFFSIKDKENDKKYYYFPTYDVVLKNPKTINWSNYYITKPERYIKTDFLEPQVLYKDNEKVAIAYRKEKYGLLTLELFTSNGNEMELSKLTGENSSAKKIVLSNKDMVLCYDISENKEVWNYDLNLNKQFEENFYNSKTN